MKLSIIICVFNEASTIEEIYKRVRNVKLIKNIKKEIIIVDNNSNDGTLEKLKKFKKDLETLIIFQNQNYGKGNSIIEGLKHAKGEYVIFQDADLEYDPENYNKLLEKIIDNNLDAVFGSRIKSNVDYHVYYLNKLAVVFFTQMKNIFYNTNFSDTATNHKLIKTEILRNLKLKSKSFALDFEIAIKLGKIRCKCAEVPIEYSPRKYNQGKKINFIDAFKSLFVIFYFLFKN